MEPALFVFLAEVAASLAVSAVMVKWLEPVLKDLLQEMCRSTIGAAFWSTFSHLMIVIAPMIVVVLFSTQTVGGRVAYAETARATLLSALIGQFIAMCLIGAVIFAFTWTNRPRTSTPQGAQDRPQPHPPGEPS